MTDPSLPVAQSLAFEITAWANENFTIWAPDYGVAEEIGELCHCILKRMQGIRGFDDDKKYFDKVKDALADAAIYLLDFCGRNQIQITFPTKFHYGTNLKYFVSQALYHTSRLLTFEHNLNRIMAMEIVDKIMQDLTDIAAVHDMHLVRDCIVPTWAKVKQRNWNKDKITGGSEVS